MATPGKYAGEAELKEFTVQDTESLIEKVNPRQFFILEAVVSFLMN